MFLPRPNADPSLPRQEANTHRIPESIAPHLTWPATLSRLTLGGKLQLRPGLAITWELEREVRDPPLSGQETWYLTGI